MAALFEIAVPCKTAGLRYSLMARHDSSRSRVTPKGTSSTPAAGSPTRSGSTTAPADRTPVKVPGASAAWVPIIMFALLVAGVLLILLNYVAPIPGAPSNWYLLGGLGLVLAGIIAATQYR
jgi:hypothetical protein